VWTIPFVGEISPLTTLTQGARGSDFYSTGDHIGTFPSQDLWGLTWAYLHRGRARLI
jgi:hypothetical protein